MNVIWRFYRDQNQCWKWQRLSLDHAVLSESVSAYKEYDTCLADAEKSGHDFQPSQAKLTRGR